MKIDKHLRHWIRAIRESENLIRTLDAFWKHNLNGWNRWAGIFKFVLAEDHSHLLPDFKKYVKSLDDIRNTNAASIFLELTGELPYDI